jgi:hypothetical protein
MFQEAGNDVYTIAVGGSLRGRPRDSRVSAGRSALDPAWFPCETGQQSETIPAQVSGPGWSEIRSCTYVPTWPQCGQVRLAIVPHRIGSDISVGEVASAKGIGSPQPAQSTTRYHFLAGAIFTMAYQCLSIPASQWALSRFFTKSSHASSLAPSDSAHSYLSGCAEH